MSTPCDEGLLAVGASAMLETAHGGSRLEAREGGKIFIDGRPVVLGSHPIWPVSVFICPRCHQTRYKLFSVGRRWACYRCHVLTHASRHKHRTIPNYHRLMRLRCFAMILSTHAIVGGAIASLFPSGPIVAAAAGFASHFAIDAIPHWDYRQSGRAPTLDGSD